MAKPIVYNTGRGPFNRAFRYRNPRFFDMAVPDTKDVIIVGDWPHIAAAYEAIGARIHQLPAGTVERLLVDVPPPPAKLIAKFDHDGDGSPGGSLPASERGLDDLKEALAALGVKVDRRWGRKRLEREIAARSDG